MKMPEPVTWAMQREDGLVLDVICPDEHESYEGQYTRPLYDKQALIDLLEEAAKKCDALYFNLNAGPDTCAQAIRSMKETL